MSSNDLNHFACIHVYWLLLFYLEIFSCIFPVLTHFFLLAHMVLTRVVSLAPSTLFRIWSFLWFGSRACFNHSAMRTQIPGCPHISTASYSNTVSLSGSSFRDSVMCRCLTTHLRCSRPPQVDLCLRKLFHRWYGRPVDFPLCLQVISMSTVDSCLGFRHSRNYKVYES